MEVVQEEGAGEDDDGDEIKDAGVLEDLVDIIPDAGGGVVDVVVLFIKLEGVDGENNGILGDGAEDHHDAGHHELVDSVKLAGGGGRGAGADVVEDVDDDKEEDDEEGHAARNHLQYQRAFINILSMQAFNMQKFRIKLDSLNVCQTVYFPIVIALHCKTRGVDGCLKCFP